MTRNPRELTGVQRAPAAKRTIRIRSIRMKTDEGVSRPFVTGVAPQDSARGIPGRKAPRVQNRRLVEWATTPLPAAEVEHVRNGDGPDPGTQLRVAFQDQVVVADLVVLHVAVGMRRKRRAV